MQGAHRPSLSQSLQNTHADIETPSWRKYAPPISDNTSDAQLSDDDTTAEAYINRYHHLALEERSRWAGPTATNPSSTPKANARTRGKSSSNRDTPFFPTPTDAFHLMQSAFKAFRDKQDHLSNRNDILENQCGVLKDLETTLTCFAEIEDKLRSAKTRLKAAVNAHAYHQGANEARSHNLEKRTLPDFTLLYPFSLNSLVDTDPSAPISPPNQPNGRLASSANRATSQPSTPPLPTNTSTLLTKEAIAMINKHAHSKADLIEEVFRLETSSMKEGLKSLARQAHISVPESASFHAISAEITSALRSRRESKHEQNRYSSPGNRVGSSSLEEFIRREIDAEKYPLLAKTFQLDADYCLDGTRRPIQSVVLGMSKESKPDQSERKPWNALLLLEPQTSAEHACRERKAHRIDRIGSRARQGPSESVDIRGFGRELAETKNVTSFENDNEVMLGASAFQMSRLDARRKLRQNVKRKLPRIHKERRTRKAFRFRDSAESISSGSSGASSSSPRWNSFREDSVGAMGMARRPSVTVQFQQVVDLDDKEDGTEPSVVYLDDES